ncbi:MAG: hypothetical protein ACK4NA_05395 [Alphaproteobacteria bacterium]
MSVGQVHGRGEAAFRDRAAPRYFLCLGLTLGLTLALFVAFSLYEYKTLGETQLGMRQPPFFGAYYAGRFLVAALLSALIVAGMYLLRPADAAIERANLTPPQRAAAWAMLLLAAASAALFAFDAGLFNRLALEDRPLEWLSALLHLAASAGFILAFRWIWRSPGRDLRRRVALGLCALLALALFVMGMEEISWMQRVFGIATPALFAENQQQEMNLHNMHSIVIGQTHKAVMFACLILLPFAVDTAPRNRLFDLLADFLPSRAVFAVSAPWAAFNYNEWNFMASQMFVTLTLAVLACYLKAALERRAGAEAALFSASAAVVLVAQPMFLALGGRFVRMWDASEYVELFIALGLALYAAETLTRLAGRARR